MRSSACATAARISITASTTTATAAPRTAGGSPSASTRSGTSTAPRWPVRHGKPLPCTLALIDDLSASQPPIDGPSHQPGLADLLGKSPAVVERHEVGLANQFDTAHRGQTRVPDDHVQQHAAQATPPCIRRDNHVQHD